MLAGNAQTVGEHLSAGSDSNIVRQEDGATPLHVAARAGEPEVALTLLASDANTQEEDERRVWERLVSGILPVVGAMARAPALLSRSNSSSGLFLHTAIVECDWTSPVVLSEDWHICFIMYIT